MNPLEYIKYLQLAEDYENGKIDFDTYVSEQNKLGKWVKRGNKMIDYNPLDGDKDDASWKLFYTYIEIGKIKEAKQKKEELEKRGFKFHEPLSRTIERAVEFA